MKRSCSVLFRFAALRKSGESSSHQARTHFRILPLFCNYYNRTTAAAEQGGFAEGGCCHYMADMGGEMRIKVVGLSRRLALKREEWP